MSKLWEVDPETRAKLLEIQKLNNNNTCVDCGAPSPQWASPKFGVFMCLNCSGIHRGLGVHISFIRSVTMDQFKVSEVERMRLGGNKPWQTFYSNHKDSQMLGRTFDDATVKERYDSEAGEEWKERLTAKVEGKEYVPGQRQPKPTESSRTNSAMPSAPQSRAETPVGRIRAAETVSAPSARTGSPMRASQKAQNEAYFASMGVENAQRPDDVPPSQGGKFRGFGSEPVAPASNDDWINDFQKDPLAGLTKGFGWLGKNAKTGYEGWVKPNVQKLAESDFGNTARLTAAQLAQNVQAGTKSAAITFNKFVEGDDHAFNSKPRSTSASGAGPDEDKLEFWDSFGSPPAGPSKDKQDFWDSFGAPPKGPSKEKKAFWDEFAAAGDVAQGQKSSSIGTSAMGKGKTGATKKEDDWSEW